MSISDWADMMPHTVVLSTLSERDTYGARTFNAGTSYAARVVYKNTRVRDAAGAEVIARGAVWLNGAPTISTEDQIELPDGTTPPIITSELFPDEDGSHHSKVYFG